MKIERAIISVSDKTGVVEFAKGLRQLGIEILSSGGTAKALREHNIEVIDIADYTGSPEMMDGRLKTLHPMVHGGILAVRDNPKHKEEMKLYNIKPIDLLVVNLYPFENTVAKADCTLEEAIENIDIGGPTMLRSAAKNSKDVAVVVDPNDYEWILEELKRNNGELNREIKFGLAQKVFAHTARYDGVICNYLNSVKEGRKTDDLPDRIAFSYKKVQDLRYGENPHQKAAFYKEYKIDGPCVAKAAQLHGKELSFNNIMDTDAAIEIVKEFKDQTFATILKHTNPCGAAVSSKSLLDAFEKAKATDPVSAFGGIVGLSREVEGETGSAIAETFFEVVIAPKFSEDALKILQKKKNVRLLELGDLTSDETGKSWSTRKIIGGLLVQDRDLGKIDLKDCKVVTKRKPTKEEYLALDFAWKICKHVKSNAIIYATGDRLLGVGAGQMSRVDSVKIAGMKMNQMEKGEVQPIVLASDAFFPFRDGIDEAATAGATAVIQPGGSVRDEESIKAADEHNMAMVLTGMRHFKH